MYEIPRPQSVAFCISGRQFHFPKYPVEYFSAFGKLKFKPHVFDWQIRRKLAASDLIGCTRCAK